MTQTNLPFLRQELELLPGMPTHDGTPSWMLHDPVQNAFHQLNETAVKLLTHWARPNNPTGCTPQTVLSNARTHHANFTGTERDIDEMTQFLLTHKLCVDPPSGESESFARMEAALRPSLHEYILHKYLYFRLPVFKPDAFLRRHAPKVSMFFFPSMWVFIAALGVIGLYFTSRQWDQFITTFWHFFTLEGLFFYGITLIILKALHELGHAFTAHYYGVRVPIIGIAFLVMFPVLYTDTTDAWRLTSRRSRLYIDAGGIIVELGIACLAIFLWSFLPDGLARSIAFFAATTSWTLSLMVNLNPCMRFDGYYLLGDFFKVQNLQKQGFDMGRWTLRETLFGLGHPKPVMTSPARERGLNSYAYLTWVYRFFLFIGIALFVHHLFPKAIGIILFSVEILWFIGLPIWREMKNWWSFRMTIITTSRGRMALLWSAVLIALFFMPWQNRLKAPAFIRPVVQTEIYPGTAARIDHIHVQNGDHVKAGAPLFTLSSKTLTHERAQSARRLALIDAQLTRRNASLTDRRDGYLLDADRQAEQAVYDGITALISDLIIYAPHDGQISELMPHLHIGRYVTGTTRLTRVIDTSNFEILAFPDENLSHRLKTSTQVRFISDRPLWPKLTGVIQTIAPTSLSEITDKIISSHHGGRLAVVPNPEGILSPQNPVLKLEARLTSDTAIHHIHRGIAIIEIAPESPAMAVWRNIIRVLLRETDF